MISPYYSSETVINQQVGQTIAITNPGPLFKEYEHRSQGQYKVFDLWKKKY